MNKSYAQKIIIAIGVFIILSIVVAIVHRSSNSVTSYTKNNTAVHTDTLATETPATSPVVSASIVAPIDRFAERATLKLFGNFVTPKNSPVQPEHFTGFHTGVDFETFPEEASRDVSISAICDGPLLIKRIAQGYGGVAVQRCEIDKQLVTVIYGHLRLSSIEINVGDSLKAGQQLGLLGTGFSIETDGERKHLHLGIHKGSTINIAGYVKSKSQTGDWLNAIQYLR